MTSRSLYFKLLAEDLKRRTWAAALLLLVFFFAFPVQLAMNIENARATGYRIYNNYNELILPQGISQAQKDTIISQMDGKVVLKMLQFGNGLTAFLLILAAVMIGVTGFSYLHNRRKVDFYHSLPVRREMLYAVQYTDGIWITAAAYLFNVVLALAVAAAYGASLEGVGGAAVQSWLLNMLFFLLIYAVVVLAMMATGHVMVGILGSAVFLTYIPLLSILIYFYCQTFFFTGVSTYWNSPDIPILQAAQWGSPLLIYIMACVEGISFVEEHIPAVIILVFAAAALSLLGLQLCRLRPSEAAGKAMAFSKSKSIVRILIVFCFGLAGGIFFFRLQSTLFWLLFGTIVGTFLTHCITEIIYNFDFKKLLSHPLQLAGTAAAAVILVLAFYNDWFGYDTFLPRQDQVASAAVDISLDSGMLESAVVIQDPKADEGQTLKLKYRDRYDVVSENMRLSDTSLALELAQMGIQKAKELRSTRYLPREMAAYETAFGSNGQDILDSSFTAIIVYHMTDGRQIGRSYRIDLSQGMDLYQELFSKEEYKKGLYPVLNMDLEDVEEIRFAQSGDYYVKSAQEKEMAQQVLEAYQQDLEDLTVEQRLENNPIGRISFVTPLEKAYEEQEYAQGYASQYPEDIQGRFQNWPVYASFSRTIQALGDWDIPVQQSFSSQDYLQVTVDMEYLYSLWEPENYEHYLGDPSALKRVNPRFSDRFEMVFDDPQEISLLLQAAVVQSDCSLNGLCPIIDSSVVLEKKDGGQVYAYLQKNRMTQEVRQLFSGTPLGEEGSF